MVCALMQRTWAKLSGMYAFFDETGISAAIGYIFGFALGKEGYLLLISSDSM